MTWSTHSRRIDPISLSAKQFCLALARAEAQSGNVIGAENYYQHAEHYFRSMSSAVKVSAARFGQTIRLR